MIWRDSLSLPEALLVLYDAEDGVVVKRIPTSVVAVDMKVNKQHIIIIKRHKLTV